MKKFLEKAFNLSMILGVLATVFCIIAASSHVYILVALSLGFFGFILACLHIMSVQRYGIKQVPVPMLLISLLLNSSPLIYMITVVMKAKGT